MFLTEILGDPRGDRQGKKGGNGMAQGNRWKAILTGLGLGALVGGALFWSGPPSPSARAGEGSCGVGLVQEEGKDKESNMVQQHARSARTPIPSVDAGAAVRTQTATFALG